MERLSDPARCREVTDLHLDYFSFDVEGWLSNPLNYALIEDDNIAFAEWKKDGLYWVHFCFHSARGRDAVRLTKEIFKSFKQVRHVDTVVGFIEVANKKAAWVVRQAGFKSLGQVVTENGLCEMFYLNKDD